MKIFSFFWPITIDQFKSKFNGSILVKEFIGRKYLDVDGLMQSGRIVDDLFRKGFKELNIKLDVNVRKILLLGLGGGTVVKTLQQLFPQAKITAFEIDPVMMIIAQKHFSLDIKKIDIKIKDVFDPKTEFGQDYDVIIVDLFKGYHIPEALGEKKFLKKIRISLAKNGYVIFNRLYFQKYIFEADRFLDKLREIFQDVKRVKIYLNILIFAR